MADVAAAISDHAKVRTRERQAVRGSSQLNDNLLHSGIGVERFVGMHVLGALLPVTAGWLLFGWRAIGAIAIVLISAIVSGLVWRTIGARGHRMHISQVAWMALLLSLTLPAQLLSNHDFAGSGRFAPWPILAIAGLLISSLMWLLGGAGSGRVHPVMIALLLLVVLFQDMLSPRFVLNRRHAFSGDLLDVNSLHRAVEDGRASRGKSLDVDTSRSRQAWIAVSQASDEEPNSAAMMIPASQRLESFTSGHEAPDRAWISLESLVRDRLPPLEDLIVGGQPAPIGQGSAIAIIIGGLFLLYRGLIDYRVPLLVVVSALVALLILPVPVVISDNAKLWKWFALRDAGVGWQLGMTFGNYEVMASPLLFTAFFLATAPGVRPLARRARVIYAVLVGTATAAFQLYVSVTIGPYLALLAVSLIGPSLDHLFRPRTLV